MGEGTRSDLKILAILLAAAVVLVGILALFGGGLVEGILAAFEPGVSLKTAAIWSFAVTVVLFILFALVAGDGLLGELPFMLGGFFSFFAVITLLIAWVF
ncbi:MAG: hypothetical protein U9Q81_22820 [Pseudomonadota bacterium]|nr:hypothetical protein [Pseudomonadota bacterium]